MKKLIVILCGFFVVGCATRLTYWGSIVRKIVEPGECEFIDSVNISVDEFRYGHRATNEAFVRLKNKIGNLGGNAYLIVNQQHHSFSIIIADAYRCP